MVALPISAHACEQHASVWARNGCMMATPTLQAVYALRVLYTEPKQASCLQSPEERDLSSTVQAALEAAVLLHQFPKANVDIYCLVMEAGGSEAAVAITAASLALADAGIEMYDLVAACQVVSH